MTKKRMTKKRMPRNELEEVEYSDAATGAVNLLTQQRKQAEPKKSPEEPRRSSEDCSRRPDRPSEGTARLSGGATDHANTEDGPGRPG
jgi:hypothetical protein